MVLVRVSCMKKKKTDRASLYRLMRELSPRPVRLRGTPCTHIIRARRRRRHRHGNDYDFHVEWTTIDDLRTESRRRRRRRGS